MAFHNSGRIVTSGLVLSLDAADRNSYVSGSTTWFDLSGNGNNGTLTNGPLFTGSNGGSIVFDGVNDYVTIPTSPSINLSTTITITVLFKMSTWKGSNIIQTGGQGAIFWIDNYYFSGGGSICWARQTSLPGQYLKSITQFTNKVGEWISIAGTYDGTTLKFYYNGVLDTSLVTSVTFVNTEFKIGTGDDGYFQGNIANIQVYNRVLSAQEVKQNYDAMKSRFNLT